MVRPVPHPPAQGSFPGRLAGVRVSVCVSVCLSHPYSQINQCLAWEQDPSADLCSPRRVQSRHGRLLRVLEGGREGLLICCRAVGPGRPGGEQRGILL